MTTQPGWWFFFSSVQLLGTGSNITTSIKHTYRQTHYIVHKGMLTPQRSEFRTLIAIKINIRNSYAEENKGSIWTMKLNTSINLVSFKLQL